MVYRKLSITLRTISFLCLILVMRVLGQQIPANYKMSKPLSPRIANYSMDVKLDVDNRLLQGTEILTWHNTTSYPTQELQFHLYYNAWRNDKSSYLNKSYRSRDDDLVNYKEHDWAYCDVRSIKILAENGFQTTDLTAAQQFLQPDDGNEFDRTVMRVALPQPLGPGEIIKLEIQWEDKVPRTFSRTGVRGDYYFLAQWFPKIGVYEAGGTWNCHQFISTEFYADFGNYDVRLTVPTNWVLGATGREVEQKENSDGTTTHRYYQEDVHDFAWTTTPHFKVFTDSLQRSALPDVKLRLLLMPDHASKRERYFSATKNALKSYGAWFGAYPYAHVTIVDPAYQSGSGGMEYPTFFTGGARWLGPVETRQPESVTIHEFGHGYWYGIVANNEFEYAWLDEGFNTYSHLRTLQTAYPPVVLTKRYFDNFIPYVFPSIHIADRLDGADGYYGFNSDLKRDPISTLSYQYGPGSYGLNSYNQPAMMLRTLENYFGWEMFQKIMSTYFESWKFKHPRPQDFFKCVNEVSGQDMSWFFEQVYNSSNVFDYGVGIVESKPVLETRGYIQSEGKLIFQTGEKYKEKNTDSSRVFQTMVIIRRWGEAIFPVEIKMTFSNGETIKEQWAGKDRWIKFDYVKKAKIEKVEVDPEHKLLLDFNYSNNLWLRNSSAAMASFKWTTKWLIWLQNLLEFFSFFS